MANKTEGTMKWCYIGENKDQVVMTCSKEEWDAIWEVIEWAKKKCYQDLLHESDEWNYGYTRKK